MTGKIRKSKPEIRTRTALERVVRLHRLLKAGKYPNGNTLAEAFEVTRRTITRDVQFMRDRLRMPIAFDASRNGYYFDGDCPNFL